MEDNMFVPEYTNQYTQDEVDTLNMEVTPEIQAILDTMLMEKAEEEAMGYVPLNGTDSERELINAIPLFEEYIRISQQRAPLQAMWEEKRMVRSWRWSSFHQEVDTNWVELDVFDRKLNQRLMVANPTPAQWEKAKAIRSVIISRCKANVSRRWDTTDALFKRALAATKACKEFWKTPHGIALSELNKTANTLWMKINELNVTWEDYNQLVDTTFNPYWTTGDTEEVDSMELMANTITEYMDMLEDASQSEDSAMYQVGSTSVRGYWSYTNAWKADTTAHASMVDDAYTRSLLAFVDNQYTSKHSQNAVLSHSVVMA